MKRILKKKCKRCGKTFLTRDLNVEYCNKGCEFDFEPMDTKELDKKPKIKYVNGLMEAIEEPEKKEKIVIKPKIEVKKEVKQEIKEEKKQEQPAPYLGENTLVNYVVELEQKLVQIDSNNQLYKQLIDDNNRERAWLNEHIERLKHIMEVEK